jgi:hypothetical protein
LNTICRPPAEEFAEAVSEEGLKSFKYLFPGIVEIINEHDNSEPIVSDAGRLMVPEIIALLARRPCTLQGVAVGLALSPVDASKLLDKLRKEGKVTTVSTPGGVFYKIAVR